MTSQHPESTPLSARRRDDLGTFAGGVAHDFNNLLTGMIGHAALAREHAPADSPLSRHLQQLETLCHRAAELCRGMLAYAGQVPLECCPVDLNRLVTDWQAEFARLLPNPAKLELQ